MHFRAFQPIVLALLFSLPLLAQENQAKESAVAESQPEKPTETERTSALAPLNKQKTVLLDRENAVVHVKSEVVLRDGTLEMLCCLKNTKEHEAILAFEGRAYLVHTALLAAGFKRGTPVSFNPYKPPTGQKLVITLRYKDKDGREQRVNAKRWIRSHTNRYYGEQLTKLPEGVTLEEDGLLRYYEPLKELSWYGLMTDKQRDAFLAMSKVPEWQKAIRSFHKRSQIHPMTADWVFAGSQIAKDEDGSILYRAEGGDFICVANFPSAMIDVGEESSAFGEEALLYEAWPERVPPVGTEVWIEIAKAADESTGKPSKDATPKTDAPKTP